MPRSPSQADLRGGEAATWGAKPASPIRPKMRLISWKPLVKNSLRGFAEFEFPSGLRLIACPVLVSHGRAWVSLPSKPVLDQTGYQKRAINGKPVYVPVVQWRDRDLQARFSAAAIELIRVAHPGGLGGVA
jgi:hypothetical protein